MRTERFAAIFIGAIMVFSILGFALMSAMMTSAPKTGTVEVSSMVNRQLTAEEKVSILQSGKVLIEYGWPENCTACQGRESLYSAFVQAWPAYIVLSDYRSNQTIEQMTGGTGQIEDLRNVTSQQELFDAFCKVAYVQPKECLLSKI